ncbi:hypothetical protein ZEAMMB73_Zm00001d040843 [Zea mays]|uniref:Uncharacterized protein n=1 Tax=Zea mays TaxID=4577 RepID=A0A1D6MTC3_MAIZE|nr:hypothetical protein ZEAMMB73_Zm00001d040843 [Zea mays]
MENGGIEETDDVLPDLALLNGQRYWLVGSNDRAMIQMTSMEPGSSPVTIDVVMTSSRQGDAKFIHICKLHEQFVVSIQCQQISYVLNSEVQTELPTAPSDLSNVEVPDSDTGTPTSVAITGDKKVAASSEELRKETDGAKTRSVSPRSHRLDPDTKEINTQESPLKGNTVICLQHLDRPIKRLSGAMQ